MGSHNMVCGDVDEDGKDEILLGSCVLDDNGKRCILEIFSEEINLQTH